MTTGCGAGLRVLDTDEAETSGGSSPGALTLTVACGKPTPGELAAAVVVLAASIAVAREASDRPGLGQPSASAWSDPRRQLVRQHLRPAGAPRWAAHRRRIA